MRITMPPATLAPMTTSSVFELLNPSVGGIVGSEIQRNDNYIVFSLSSRQFDMKPLEFGDT
jgi:hypothetical protein